MTGTLSTRGMILANKLKEKRRMEKSRNPNPKTPKMMGSAKGKKEDKKEKNRRQNVDRSYLIKKRNNKFKKLKG
jgi:hypothetical protein